MKIGEKIHHDGDKIIIQKTYDDNPVLNRVAAAKQANGGVVGENRFVGSVPLHLMATWAKEAGIKWDDPAMKEVVKRKMMSGDFAKLRAWEGNY